MKKSFRDTVARVEAAGIPVVGVATGSKHWRIYVDTPVGRRFYTTGQTPSDFRVQRKVVRDVVRLAETGRA